MLIDNFRSHHAFDTLEYAEMLDICLVFLPPYSPDLNPIEYIWKDVKKMVSTHFVTCKEEMRTLINDTYTELSKKLSMRQRMDRPIPHTTKHKYKKLGA